MADEHKIYASWEKFLRSGNHWPDDLDRLRLRVQVSGASVELTDANSTPQSDVGEFVTVIRDWVYFEGKRELQHVGSLGDTAVILSGPFSSFR